jgi:hypothetical protein
MKKNKPTVAKSQAKGLQELDNFFKSGGDESFVAGIKQAHCSDSGFSFISAQESKAIGDAINCGGDGMLGRLAGIDCTGYCKKYPKDCQYTPNANGGIFSNLGLAGLDFSNFDFTKLANLNLSNIKK